MDKLEKDLNNLVTKYKIKRLEKQLMKLDRERDEILIKYIMIKEVIDGTFSKGMGEP